MSFLLRYIMDRKDNWRNAVTVCREKIFSLTIKNNNYYVSFNLGLRVFTEGVHRSMVKLSSDGRCYN